MYLKWEDETIGIINPETHEVSITNPRLNSTVENLFQKKSHLSAHEWQSFLVDRIVSRDRKDIEKILFRMGLSRYDAFRIASITRAINPKDKCWIAFSPDETYRDCVQKTLKEFLLKNHNTEGSSLSTPNGQHIKQYGSYNSKFGIYKKRLHPLSTDVESEVAVFLLAQKMNIPCCPAVQIDKDTVFSEFLYDFNQESFVHFRNLFKDGERGENELDNIMKVRPQYEIPVFQMLAIDFITHQDDRHLSNFAIKISGDEESFYPLYDNGNALFFQDSEELVKEKCTDPVLYANSFGPVGTQWDMIEDMLKANPSLIHTINLEISDAEIDDILKKANITGYRYDGCRIWIRKSLDLVKELSLSLNKEKKTLNIQIQEAENSKILPSGMNQKQNKAKERL